MISAITNQGLVRFSFFEGAIDADRFILFLGDLAKKAQRKVFLTVDNLRGHHANWVPDWVANNAAKIKLFYLLLYAPELNLDEPLNRGLKTAIRSGAISQTATALFQKANAYMEQIAAMPDRVRSYFNHEHARYA